MNDFTKYEWEEFLDWIEDNKHDFPEWLDESMSMYEARMLWKKRVKNNE